MLYNLVGVIARARAAKTAAWSQAQLIRVLDPFQHTFNLPCWMSDTEQFRLILAEITEPKPIDPQYYEIVNLTI